jgi:predicted TIM-barrel fold metal-dependent hydrolase
VPPDTEFDALPLDGVPPFQVPWRLRLENPEWRAAQSALFGIPNRGTDSTFRMSLHARRAQELAAHGDGYPAWVLDRAGIDVMFANRIVSGPGLTPPRFRWVAFDDALMLPLDTQGEAARSPDTRSLYPKEAALLRRYMRDLNVERLPATLDEYLSSVLRATLERQRRNGAVAVKFEAAYLRPLDFGDADAAEAARIYARYAAGGAPTRAEYKTLQDYLFKEIAREAGRLGMAVHIHALDTFGGFYNSRGSAPHQLEPTFNDSTLRGTSFVLIHGGWPLFAQTQSMLGKPNVYADISMMVLVAEPRELANTLRSWLTAWPEKVLFGTDAFDGGPDQGWEEGVYLGTSTARRALALALTGMMRDGEIDRARAETLARMVLRENAAKLYGTALASR